MASVDGAGATPSTAQRSPRLHRASPDSTGDPAGDPARDPMSAEARQPQRELLERIIRSYERPVVRAYCRVRFLIIRQDFLNEVLQYLPERGNVLDVGCGFGLFALYFAGTGGERRLCGYDLDGRRVAMARLAARAAGIGNARFEIGDARQLALSERFDAIYALDLMHHLPERIVPGLLLELHRALRPLGVLVIKDVDSRPFYKRWFTLALDRLMVGLREPIRYWSREEMRTMLRSAGFEVRSHTLRDVLPYPHVLHICHKSVA